jgi:hypothetical protein
MERDGFESGGDATEKLLLALKFVDDPAIPGAVERLVAFCAVTGSGIKVLT